MAVRLEEGTLVLEMAELSVEVRNLERFEGFTRDELVV